MVDKEFDDSMQAKQGIEWYLAGAEGIEPSSWLLESQVLPLNDAPVRVKYTKSGLSYQIVKFKIRELKFCFVVGSCFSAPGTKLVQSKLIFYIYRVFRCGIIFAFTDRTSKCKQIPFTLFCHSRNYILTFKDTQEM